MPYDQSHVNCTSRIGFVAAALLVLSLPSAFSAQEPIGHIVAIEGQATALGTDSPSRALELKNPVFLKDKINTGAGAKLQIMFNDDSMISQGENSELLIDEYVYNPGTKEDNGCALRVFKGLVRVVTGQITKLNPERFQVRTRMATIGIRGCNLGFSVTEQAENIYVISFGAAGETIVVYAKPDVGQEEWNLLIRGDAQTVQEAQTRLRNVTEPNRVVSIAQQGPISETPITPEQMTALIDGVTLQSPTQ